jgi:putative intracellular protease/amidase
LIKNSILLVLPALDFNEQEYNIIAQGIKKAGKNLFIASDANSLCTGSEGQKVKYDIQFYNIHESNFDGIIFIGGKGVLKYWDNKNLHSVIQKFSKQKKLIGAICSAVIIPAKAGINFSSATCFPDNKKELEKEGIEYKNEPVVVSGNIITGRDPLAAGEFVKLFLYELAKKS